MIGVLRTEWSTRGTSVRTTPSPVRHGWPPTDFYNRLAAGRFVPPPRSCSRFPACERDTGQTAAGHSIGGTRRWETSIPKEALRGRRRGPVETGAGSVQPALAQRSEKLSALP